MGEVRIAVPQNSDLRVPAFLIREKIEPLMANHGLNVESWSGAPRKVWFQEKPGELGLYLADGGLSGDLQKFCFDNGRHRTRWLLNTDIEHIPVYLDARGYYSAIQAKIIHRRAFYEEPIPGLMRSFIDYE